MIMTMRSTSAVRSSSRRKRVRSKMQEAEESAAVAVPSHLQHSAPQRARPIDLREHVDAMAASTHAYLQRLQEMGNAGLVDRRKVVEWM